MRALAPKAAVLFAAAAVLLAGAGRLHLFRLQADWERTVADALRQRLAAVEDRKDRLVSRLQASADRAAALPEARAALGGDRAALSRLFRSLESMAGTGDAESPALAVHALPFTTIAWAGRGADLVGLAAAGREEGVVVLAGTVTTTLVAVAEVRGADGGPIGLATAQTAVRVQRNIRNEYLEDFDRLVGDDPSAEVRYRDAFEPAPPPFSSAPAGVPVLEATLAAPEGRILASVRLLSLPREKAAYTLALSYRRGVAALAAAGVLSWMLGPTPRRMGWRLRLALGATALRILALFVAVKLSPAASSLLSSDAYASTLVGPLSRSPIDLLLTAAWAFVLAGLLLERALVLGPSRPSPARALGAAALAFPLLGGVFGWIADTSANCPLDLETITVLPRSAAHLAMQVSLLAILGTGLLLVAGLLALGGPWPRGGAARALRAASWVALGLLAYRLWPRELIGIPLLPAIGLFMLAAALAGTHRSWHPWIVAAPAGAQAGWALAGVATLSLLLHPTLVHFAEKEARQQIELSHAPLILRQPQWREHNLEQARKRIDEIAPLEQAAGAVRPGVEELAFSVWAATDLATFGFSSALEIQDPSGAVISRFGLNMPSLSVSGPPRPLPAHDTWRVSRERLRLASAERPVLHARRRLSHDGEVRGAVHLYIGEDFWNLPFIPARDPYSVLYRTAGRRGGRGQPAALLVYDAARAKVFSSADRPPALRADLAHRLRAERGLWTTLPIDGRPHHTFLFTDGQSTFGLGFPRVGAGRFVADLVEAMASMTLVALLVLLALMASRTALRRPSLSLPSLGSAVRRRFALRVFVAFVTVALVPVAVLEIVVLRFVADRLHRESEDQGLEKAAVAQKAVEDFAYFQRGEAPGGEPVTDAALVWVSSLIRNDLDVFSRGRILASSKRELYASGLLPARVSGAVFRSLILDQAPSVLRTETIGGFSTLVASVPVRLQGVEPGILSIPLTLRQREVQATLEDLDRANRLASVGFLLLAALLSHSMARRISDPIRDLTRATRRVAAGDLEARVLTEARDELRELVESFNQMARDLDTQRTDLERSNRLAAWADMARQVAHEVKNPLTPIQLSAEHLRRVFRDGGPDFDATLEACTGNILRQVETLRRIVTEFSAFARPPARDLTLTDPATLVTEAIAPYATGLPAGVRLSVEAPAGLPAARLDRRLVERAVLNLVENALQAVGERGTIAVRVQAHDGRVEIEVEDSGPGVDPDIRERMFEPFFSTKTGGSGLGLALVKKIAEDHGGGASLASGPGEGTRVQIWFPAARGAAALSDGEKPGGAT